MVCGAPTEAMMPGFYVGPHPCQKVIKLDFGSSVTCLHNIGPSSLLATMSSVGCLAVWFYILPFYLSIYHLSLSLFLSTSFSSPPQVYQTLFQISLHVHSTAVPIFFHGFSCSLVERTSSLSPKTRKSLNLSESISFLTCNKNGNSTCPVDLRVLLGEVNGNGEIICKCCYDVCICSYITIINNKIIKPSLFHFTYNVWSQVALSNMVATS